MKQARIHISLSHMGGEEQKHMRGAFGINRVGSLGGNVDVFAEELADFFCGDYCVAALGPGTAAIHLGLVLAGVKAGDEVLGQLFTFSASANPVEGARPLFFDSEEEMWDVYPSLLEEAIVSPIRETGKRSKSIVCVHAYGMPLRMDEFIDVYERYGIRIVEDSAEAMESEFRGQRCGALGSYGVLSNGDKEIMTSGGGAFICHTSEVKEKTFYFAIQEREPKGYNLREHAGYNYRMSNALVGIRREQMQAVDNNIVNRCAFRVLYLQQLQHLEGGVAC